MNLEYRTFIMDKKELDIAYFLSFCIEQYKVKQGLSGEDTMNLFEKYNVFSPAMIDGIINKLQSYNDKILRSELKDNPEAMLALVNRYFHCG